ncbi:outer membrane beta-barrel domain-containing protein [bacterium]|nr:outer membrane beta-barrel domain-containing protein [bacterium]
MTKFKALTLVFVAITSFSFTALAQEKKEETVTKTRPNTVEFSADNVWNVDIFEQEDHKVLVIQDRKYNKAKRLELGLEAGTFAASPFYSSYSYGGRVAYHLTEYLGIESFFNASSSSLNKHGKQISDFLSSRSFSSTKEFREPKWYTGVGVIWSPIYGKFAFFRSNIIHYDFHGVAGLSAVKTNSNVLAANGGSDQTSLGTLFSLGMRVFLNKNWVWRFDARQAIYRVNFAPTSTGGNAEKVTLINYQFTTGFSYMFNLGGF